MHQISDPIFYENLLLNGLNFFDTALFIAVPDKWRTQGFGRNNLLNSSESSILQCYKCQVIAALIFHIIVMTVSWCLVAICVGRCYK